MKREFLKKMGLTDEQIDSIMAEHGTTVNDLKSNLTTVTADRDTLKKEVSTRDTQLQTLKDSTGDVETMKQTIKDLEAANKTAKETYQKELEKVKLEGEVEKALIVSKPRNTRAVQALLDLSIVKLEDGKVVGLKEQLENLKKTDGYLFEADSNTDQNQEQQTNQQQDTSFNPGTGKLNDGQGGKDLKALGAQRARERFGLDKKEENKQ